MTLVVRRSAVRMWLMAMGGIPLTVISLDVLTNRRITNWLREIVFRPEDTQIYEPRDVIWAWVMLLFGVFFVVWGLKELFLPTKVVECRDRGLAIALSGPFGGPTIIPWALIEEVRVVELEDEGDRLPMLALRLSGSEGLPEDPWGARWLDGEELAILAADWAEAPGEVADRIGECAAEAATRRSRERTAGIWAPGEET